MLRVIGGKSKITRNSIDINNADGIILLGVGAFDAGMKKMIELRLDEEIRSQAKKGKPILGICLRMQLLGRGSEEGKMRGCPSSYLNARDFVWMARDLKFPIWDWKAHYRSIDGETAEVIRETQCGYCGKADDVNSLVENIRVFMNSDEKEKMGMNARKFYEKFFAWDKFMDKLEEKLRKSL